MGGWRELDRARQGVATARCLVACTDLVAGRRVGTIDGIEATALRHLIRIHALSGVASRAIDNGMLSMSYSHTEGIRQDFAQARSVVIRLDQECIRIGIAAMEVAAHSFLSTPVLLKGPAVSGRYRDPEVRPYVDIDLLVPARELLSWAGVLRELGYRAPQPEVCAAARRHQEGVLFVLDSQGESISCDLHACVFIESRAREVTHRRIAEHSESSRFPGLLQPARDVMLVTLALHLAHHETRARRLIWLRDFIELGDEEAVHSARTISMSWDVTWALERALLATEAVLGYAAWNAASPAEEPFGLARVHQLDSTHYLRHAALIYELGPIAGIQYLVSRVDPRRFQMKTGKVDWRAFREWVRLAYRRIKATLWFSGFGPRRQ